MATVISDITPVELLERFRGVVVLSRPSYPEVIHLEVRDDDGAQWGFMSFDATFTPSDPAVFRDKTIVGADLTASGELTIQFSDGPDLTVVPMPLEPDEWEDDLENWKLFTPYGFVLNYGPGSRWKLKLNSETV